MGTVGFIVLIGAAGFSLGVVGGHDALCSLLLRRCCVRNYYASKSAAHLALPKPRHCRVVAAAYIPLQIWCCRSCRPSSEVGSTSSLRRRSMCASQVPSIDPSIYRSVHRPIHRSIDRSIDLSMYRYIRVSVCVSVCVGLCVWLCECECECVCV
jgi:hypothetical protein